VLVVIDTNLWVSGLLWRGMPWRLLRLAERGRVTLCMAPAMVAELAEVLTYERLQPRLQQLGLTPAALIAYVLNVASIFEVPESEKASIVAADPDDDIFLRCAVVAGVAYVVSGDHHLLDLENYAGVPIITVRDFLAREFPDWVID
jgi:putative PIN family toxin of toxin-antitoxin system